jgi:hypothetical protein
MKRDEAVTDMSALAKAKKEEDAADRKTAASKPAPAVEVASDKKEDAAVEETAPAE